MNSALNRRPRKARLHCRVLLSLSIAAALLPPASPAQSSDLRITDTFADSGHTSFPFEFRKEMIFVPVRLNGSRPLAFVIDTGSAKMLVDRTVANSLGLKTVGRGSLQGAGAGRIPIEFVPNAVQDSFLIHSGSSDAVDHPIVMKLQSRTPTEGGIGLGNAVQGATARATSFQLGPYTLANLTVSCCGATDETSKLIGNDVLKYFTVTLDYPSARILITPNTDFPVKKE